MSPGGEMLDAIRSVVAAESTPCEGARWATAVAAAGSFAEPEPLSEGTVKTESPGVSAAGKLVRARDCDRPW